MNDFWLIGAIITLFLDVSFLDFDWLDYYWYFFTRAVKIGLISYVMKKMEFQSLAMKIVCFLPSLALHFYYCIVYTNILLGIRSLTPMSELFTKKTFLLGLSFFLLGTLFPIKSDGSALGLVFNSVEAVSVTVGSISMLVSMIFLFGKAIQAIFRKKELASDPLSEKEPFPTPAQNNQACQENSGSLLSIFIYI